MLKTSWNLLPICKNPKDFIQKLEFLAFLENVEAVTRLGPWGLSECPLQMGHRSPDGSELSCTRTVSLISFQCQVPGDCGLAHGWDQVPAGTSWQLNQEKEARVPHTRAGVASVSSSQAVLWLWQGQQERKGRRREGLGCLPGNSCFSGQVPLRQKNERLQPSSAGGLNKTPRAGD